jgi:hypothetical protein
MRQDLFGIRTDTDRPKFLAGLRLWTGELPSAVSGDADGGVRNTRKRPQGSRLSGELRIGWEAGIRTPITWSRATCPTVERPPSRVRTGGTETTIIPDGPGPLATAEGPVRSRMRRRLREPGVYARRSDAPGSSGSGAYSSTTAARLAAARSSRNSPADGSYPGSKIAWRIGRVPEPCGTVK